MSAFEIEIETVTADGFEVSVSTTTESVSVVSAAEFEIIVEPPTGPTLELLTSATSVTIQQASTNEIVLAAPQVDVMTVDIGGRVGLSIDEALITIAGTLVYIGDGDVLQRLP